MFDNTLYSFVDDTRTDETLCSRAIILFRILLLMRFVRESDVIQYFSVVVVVVNTITIIDCSLVYKRLRIQLSPGIIYEYIIQIRCHTYIIQRDINRYLQNLKSVNDLAKPIKCVQPAVVCPVTPINYANVNRILIVRVQSDYAIIIASQ